MRVALERTDEAGDAYVFGWDTTPETSPFGATLTPLSDSGIVDFTNPEAYAWWREAHRILEGREAFGKVVLKRD